MKTVLRKLGAIVVESCGGPEARAAFSRTAAHAHAEGRNILRCSARRASGRAPVGVRFRYRVGVYHMARDFDLPVVPVASSLGVFWTQENWTKRPGQGGAGIPRSAAERPGEAPLGAGPGWRSSNEDRTAELVAEATGPAGGRRRAGSSLSPNRGAAPGRRP